MDAGTRGSLYAVACILDDRNYATCVGVSRSSTVDSTIANYSTEKYCRA